MVGAGCVSLRPRMRWMPSEAEAVTFSPPAGPDRVGFRRGQGAGGTADRQNVR